MTPIFIISETRPVAALPHRCSICLGTIESGERHVRYSYRDDDQRDPKTGKSKFFAVRTHIHCPIPK
jgi:hypothetical protein